MMVARIAARALHPLLGLSACGFALFGFLPAAQAQSKDELRQRIEALEAELSAIKRELTRSSPGDPTPAPTAEPEVAQRDASASLQDRLLGATEIEVYGFIDLDVHLTKFSDGDLPSASIGRDFYLAQLTPVAPGNPGEGGYDTDFSIKTSRIGLTSNTPLGDGMVNSRLELDFLLSPGGNERISNSFNPRVRRAYVDYDGWRVGQEWTTFQALQAMPESASFYTPSESQVFIRQPMIRYSIGNLQLALENPNTNVAGVGLVDDGVLPDAIVRYNSTGRSHYIALSGLFRQLRYRDGPIDGKAFGWGLSLAGRVNLGADDIRFSLQSGQGMGRYVGLGIAPGAAIDVSGSKIEPIDSFSGNLAYRWVLGTTSLSTGVSFIEIDNNPDITSETATRRSRSAFAALTHRLSPELSVASEFLYGEREVESGLSGNLRRITFSVRQGF